MSTKEQLDQATFESLLEIHGARIQAWPEALREQLSRLLEGSEVARARWDDAAELDAWLDAVPEIEPASDLVARIASLPALHPHPERLGWWPFGNPLAPLLAWGAAAVLGMALGVLATPDLGIDLGIDDTDSMADWAGSGDEAADDQFADDQAGDDQAADDDGADDWTEVSGLVMGADWAPEDE